MPAVPLLNVVAEKAMLPSLATATVSPSVMAVSLGSVPTNKVALEPSGASVLAVTKT